MGPYTFFKDMSRSNTVVLRKPSHTECAKILEPFVQICYIARDCVEFACIISNLCSKILRNYFCAIAQKKFSSFFFKLIMRANSTHRVRTQQNCVEIAQNLILGVNQPFRCLLRRFLRKKWPLFSKNVCARYKRSPAAGKAVETQALNFNKRRVPHQRKYNKMDAFSSSTVCLNWPSSLQVLNLPQMSFSSSYLLTISQERLTVRKILLFCVIHTFCFSVIFPVFFAAVGPQVYQ